MPRSIPIAGLPVGISIRPEAKDEERKKRKREEKKKKRKREEIISDEILVHYIHKQNIREELWLTSLTVGLQSFSKK